MTTAAALFAERQAQLDAELAEVATARSTLGQHAHELEAALDGTQQILASHAAEVERLTRREAELTSMLADAATTRSTLESSTRRYRKRIQGRRRACSPRPSGGRGESGGT